VEAWRKLAKEINNYPNILEFDLKKFHDTIDHKFLSKALIRMGLNINFVRKLVNLQSPYTLGPLNKDDPNIRTEELDKFGYEIFGREPTPRLNRWNILCGVPQGANTSSLMGIIALEALNVYELKDAIYIGYADDGVILSKTIETLEELEMKLQTVWSGIRLKPEKTRWVKEGNKWLHSLKFLGCEWTSDGFYSNTRSGKRKKWEWGDLENITELEKDWVAIQEAKPSGWSGKTLKLGNNSPYSGLLFAELFKGESDKKANRELEYIDGSWLDLTKRFCKLENASSYAITALRHLWRDEWSKKQPLKYKGKMTKVMQPMDEPGWVPHPIFGTPSPAQLTDANLYQPHFAQPTPLYPKEWPPQIMAPNFDEMFQALMKENTTTNPDNQKDNSFLLTREEREAGDILKELFSETFNMRDES
jgi:hypothetical protein